MQLCMSSHFTGTGKGLRVEWPWCGDQSIKPISALFLSLYSSRSMKWMVAAAKVEGEEDMENDAAHPPNDGGVGDGGKWWMLSGWRGWMCAACSFWTRAGGRYYLLNM